ncbi:hypothetical protein M9H77_16395 [Catharanthus roseus]|uniref:Uncharacterized protein n=1 Tax=Catharanthus roseus TaxID=4058 RepID=A0ACC0B1N0_CATRO|nr:hypothetical protein M9H77_16395 [Catharanthus roseus]
MAMCENWQLFVHDGRHNHAIGVYSHSHAQAAKLTEEQLIQIEQFRKSHVPTRNILRFFREQNVGCAVRYVASTLMHLGFMFRDYTVFYRNREDSNMLSDIVVAHPTSIEILRTWPHVLIMDTTYKTNKYNMPLLEVVGMTPTENQEDVCETMPKSRPDFLHYLFNNWLNPFAHKFVRCWTKSHMHFGVETTNWAESEHSVLKLCLSKCHGNLDTVFLNIDLLNSRH